MILRLPRVAALVLATAFAATALAQSQYNIYYGDFHSHTWYSDGSQDQNAATYTVPVARGITYAKSSPSMNFLGISEHNHTDGGLHMTLPYWRSGFREADSVNQDGTFVGMFGQEWGVISNGGHVCIYGTDRLFGWNTGVYDVFVTKSDYKMLFDSVYKYGGFAYLAHPQSTDYGGIFSGAYNALWDSVVSGVAITSGVATSTNTTETNPASQDSYIARYLDLLRLGYHVAPAENQDNHNTTYGRVNQQRTAVLATSLTRANVLDALRNMHAYGTNDHNLQLRFESGTHIMGDIFTISGNVPIRVTTYDPDGEHLSSIQLYYGIPGSGTAATVLTSNSGQDSLIYSVAQSVNTTYYYFAKVTQTDGNTAWSAPIWVTTITAAPPAAFNLTSPAGGATNQPVNGTLSWAASTGATGYDVYFGTSPTPTTLVSTNQAGTSYSYSGLSYSATYYWYVVAKNSLGSTPSTSAPWSFGTKPPPPAAFSLTTPANGATGQPVGGSLTWNSSANATGYDVYLGTANPPTTRVSANQAATSYSYSGLANSTVYYWKVVAKNALDSLTATGAPWSFTTVQGPPGAFALTAPLNSTANQPLAGTLSWAASATATGYDVYLSPDNPPTTRVSASQTGTSYSYSGLNRSTVYYWKVVAKNAVDSTAATGAPWNFTTIPPAPSAFTLSAPTDGATSQPTSGTVSWQAASGATQYDVYLDTLTPPLKLVSSGQAGTNYAYSGLLNNRGYFWNIVAKNTGGSTSSTNGPLTFTTIVAPPGAFTLSAPANGAGSRPLADTLRWNAATGASAYDVYLDTINPPAVLAASGIAGTSTPVSGLQNGRTYYWNVRATNVAGPTVSANGPFAFTTVVGPPAQFPLTAPATGAADQPLNATLQWSPAPAATSYDILLDTVTPPGRIVSTGQAGTSFVCSGLANSTTYYWNVIAKNAGGTSTTVNGPFNFTTIMPPPGMFSLSSPASGSTGLPLTDTLQWSPASGAAGYDVYFDTVSPPIRVVSINQAGTRYTASGLTYDKIYYWSVVARNIGGSTSASVQPFTFRTVIAPPGAFSLQGPADGSNGLATTDTLRWAVSAGAASYDVYLDTVAPPQAVVATNLTVTRFRFSNLQNGKTYHWNVVARNAGGSASPVLAWSFTTTSLPFPHTFQLLAPSDGAVNRPTSGQIGWSSSLNASAYDVYCDTVNPPVVKLSADQTDTTYAYASLSVNRVYYWNVVARSPSGSIAADGGPWSFATIFVPKPFSLVSPADGQGGVSLIGPLQWTTSVNATGYDVYLDTIAPPQRIAAGNIAATSFSCQDLQPSRTYHWTVVARNANGIQNADGAYRTFQTGFFPAPAVRGSAVADAPRRIRLAWADSATNETGYRIARSSSPNSGFVQMGDDLAPNTVSFTDTGLAPDHRYYYRIVAFNAVGEAPPLAVDAATVADQPAVTLVSPPGYQSAHVAIGTGMNPPSTLYAVAVTLDTLVRYLQPGGTLGPAAYWGDITVWGDSAGCTIAGMRGCASYGIAAAAMNEEGLSTQFGTPLGISLPCYAVTRRPAAGWNLVSLPINTTPVPVGTLLPGASSRAFSYEGAYTPHDSLVYGRGYWVKMALDTTLAISGNPSTQDTVALVPGWNLIGTVSVPVAVGDVAATPGAMAISPFFGFDGSYGVADTLHPFHAYWVRAAVAGKLLLQSSALLQKSVPRQEHAARTPDTVAILSLTDRSGHSRSLAVLVSEGDPSAFALPPLPPAGAFDARFGDQTSALILGCTATSRSASVLLQAVSYPVTLRWDIRDKSGWSVDWNSQGERIALRGRGAAALAGEPGSGMLSLHRTASSSGPRTCALHQNFPDPFNPTTRIGFVLAWPSTVTLKVYDILGNEIATLVDREAMPEGGQEVEFDGSALASGIYFYRLSLQGVDDNGGLNQYSSVRKMLLMK